MGTESRSPAAKSARARAVKRATAAVDADATAAPLTSVGSSARDSDACVEERVIVEPRGLATSVAGFPVTNDTPEHADAPDKSCASVELNDSSVASNANASPDASTASDDLDDRTEPDDDDASDFEAFIESDPALAPSAPSQLLVAPRVLDAEEVIALLQGLTVLLDGGCEHGEGHEPHAASTGCDRRDPKLPSLAWLFPYHAGAGRPARHKQGDHLRARRGPGKKARPAPRQAQGSLFGDHHGGTPPG